MRKRGLCCRKMSVLLAGWMSHAGNMSKRRNISENFFDHLVAPSFRLFDPCAGPNSKGNPVNGAKNTRGWENLRFSTEIAVYLGNGAR